MNSCSFIIQRFWIVRFFSQMQIEVINLPLQKLMLRFGVRETQAFMFSNIYLHNAYQGII